MSTPDDRQPVQVPAASGPDEPRRGLTRWMPLLATLGSYPGDAWRGDLVAGASACIVMIPSVVAYSELVGVPPTAGLYAALGAMLAYALFGSGKRIIAGPDAAIALLAGSAIAPLAGGDPVRALALAGAMAVMTGIMLLGAARLQVGDVADLLSKPVLVGYLNGAALILASTQLGKLMNVSLERDQFFLRVYDAIRAIPHAHVPTVVTGLSLIAILLLLRRFVPKVPDALAVCAIAIAASAAFNLPVLGVKALGVIPQGLPRPAIPWVSIRDLQEMAPASLGIAFLAFAEGVLLARAFAAKRRETVDANQELVALGASNAGAGLLGGFCVTASQSRSAIVESTGGRTQVAQLVAAGLLVLFLMFLAPVLGSLPVVTLGAILVVAGVSMVDVRAVQRLRSFDKPSFRVSIAVTIAVLVVGVVPGILIGVILSLVKVLMDIARPRDAVLRRVAADNRFHDLDDDEPGDSPPGVLVFRPYAALIFPNARYFCERLKHLIGSAAVPVRLAVIDFQAVTDMDLTALEAVEQLYQELRDTGVEVRLARVNRPLFERLTSVGIVDQLGPGKIFTSSSAAVDDFLAGSGQPAGGAA